MELLTAFSNALAEAIDAVAPSVVQVKGRRPPASGLVFADGLVMTMVSALGRGDGLHVRRHDGRTHEAELAGWDPATGLAALRVNGLDTTTSIAPAAPPRVGHVALAVARSWRNVVTASSGIVSIIGGPLRTGRHRSIDQVIRTTAPMHDGFAGGAFLDVSGGLIGIATASSIRGLGVVIPTSIAWKVAAALFEHGHVKRGYLGIASHAVRRVVASPAANAVACHRYAYSSPEFGNRSRTTTWTRSAATKATGTMQTAHRHSAGSRIETNRSDASGITLAASAPGTAPP